MFQTVNKQIINTRETKKIFYFFKFKNYFKIKENKHIFNCFYELLLFFFYF